MKSLIKLMILIAIILAALSNNPGLSCPRVESGQEFRQNGCDRMRDTFADVLLAYNVPGGMIILHTADCESLGNSDMSPKETNTLTERLDSLVHAVPSYKWRKQDGVINVEPRRVEVRLLDTQVPRFAYNTHSNLNSVLDSLKNTPEFAREMHRANLLDGPYFGGLQSPPSTKPGTDVVLHNKSVRQILNDIVQRRGRGLWVYSERVIDGYYRFTLQFVIR